MDKKIGSHIEVSTLFERHFNYFEKVKTIHVDEIESIFTDDRMINIDSFEKYIKKTCKSTYVQRITTNQ